MNNQDIKIQSLLLKAQLDRVQLKRASQQAQENLSVETVKDLLSQAGSETVANLLPTIPGVFDVLQKYPSLSFSVAKGLIRFASQSTGLWKTVAMGVASWFVYNRFQAKGDESSKI